MKISGVALIFATNSSMRCKNSSLIQTIGRNLPSTMYACQVASNQFPVEIDL